MNLFEQSGQAAARGVLGVRWDGNDFSGPWDRYRLVPCTIKLMPPIARRVCSQIDEKYLTPAEITEIQSKCYFRKAMVGVEFRET